MRIEEDELRKFQVGAHFFIPADPIVIVLDKPQYGYGEIEYSEGSIYQGPLYFDGGHFNKIGFGCQDFTHSSICGDAIGAPMNTKLYKYVGEFDYRETDWIYGNGVFYFVDSKTLKPFGFVLGFFAGIYRVDKYQGEFDYSTLLDGFTKDMEIKKLYPHQALLESLNKKYTKRECEYLFVGDSWFEMWTWSYDNGRIKNLFEEDFKDYDAINIGVGGTAYQDWIDFYKDFLLSFKTKKMILNLGFNDLHFNSSIKRTFKNFTEFIKIVHDHDPNVQIYVNAVTHGNNFPRHLHMEEEYNAMVEEYVKTKPYLHYGKVNLPFLKDGKPIKNLDDFYISDRIHLNFEGYKLWVAKIKEYIL